MKKKTLLMRKSLGMERADNHDDDTRSESMHAHAFISSLNEKMRNYPVKRKSHSVMFFPSEHFHLPTNDLFLFPDIFWSRPIMCHIAFCRRAAMRHCKNIHDTAPILSACVFSSGFGFNSPPPFTSRDHHRSQTACRASLALTPSVLLQWR